MAGNRDRQRIGCARLCHGTHRFWRADALGNLGVARRFADRNFGERLPNALLKRGAAHIERQVEPYARRFDEADHFRDQLFERLIAIAYEYQSTDGTSAKKL